MKWRKPMYSSGRSLQLPTKDNPGPGSYDVKPPEGRTSNWAHYSGRSKAKFTYTPADPGPGEYNNHRNPVSTGLATSRTAKIGPPEKPRPPLAEATPGPIYDVSPRRNTACPTFAGRDAWDVTAAEKLNHWKIGPGAYTVTKKPARGPDRAASLGARITVAKHEDSPGPGAYEADPVVHFSENWKQYSINGRSGWNTTAPDWLNMWKPGPGTYGVPHVPSWTSPRKSIGAKPRSTEHLASDTPGPGAYSIPTTKPAKSKGRIPQYSGERVPSEMPGPGAYDTQNLKSTTGIAKFRQTNLGPANRQAPELPPHSPLPGPASYTPLPLRSLNTCSFAGRESWEVTAPDRVNRWKPGPGSSGSPNDKVGRPQGPAFSLKGRPEPPVISDRNAPGPGTHNPRPRTTGGIVRWVKPGKKLTALPADPGPAHYDTAHYPSTTGPLKQAKAITMGSAPGRGAKATIHAVCNS